MGEDPGCLLPPELVDKINATGKHKPMNPHKQRLLAAQARAAHPPKKPAPASSKAKVAKVRKAEPHDEEPVKNKKKKVKKEGRIEDNGNAPPDASRTAYSMAKEQFFAKSLACLLWLTGVLITYLDTCVGVWCLCTYMQCFKSLSTAHRLRLADSELTHRDKEKRPSMSSTCKAHLIATYIYSIFGSSLSDRLLLCISKLVNCISQLHHETIANCWPGGRRARNSGYSSTVWAPLKLCDVGTSRKMRSSENGSMSKFLNGFYQ